MRVPSAVRVYPGLENGWTGYKQLAGSWYASTKRAKTEVHVLSCVCGYHGQRLALLESFDTL